MRTGVFVALSLSTALAMPAYAEGNSFNFSLRGGVGTAPDYPGANSYGAQPDLGFTFGGLKVGNVSIGSGIGELPATGLSFRGAFRVIGSRKASDNAELAGLNDISTAVELGFGLIYREDDWQVFGDVRHGFGGHHGVTGTVGFDSIFRPNDRLTIKMGPRINFGNSEYASTYFGVSAAEAAASSYSAYAPDGGVLGGGVALEATYRLDDKWAVEGLLSYEKLLNDARLSPITQAGSDDQWTLRIGLSRSFNLQF
ncbi:MAG: MipA/OmpV family protein [Sulfitobacter sp.]